MPDETIDQKLREMAEHRGFKLIKSRRRKPGTGDFGKFGLTQPDGKPILGMSEAGLTASAGDIEAYLRKGSVSTWRASAENVPARSTPAQKRTRQTKTDDDENASVIRPRPTNAGNRSVDPTKTAPISGKAQQAEKPNADVEQASKTSPGRRSAPPEAKSAARAVVESPPAPAPVLSVRAAKAADAAGLVRLLEQLADVKPEEIGIARNLEMARKAKGGVVVAELATVVGCCAWALLPTVQYGLIGRITMILVDEDHRRRGIATAMFDVASAALGKAGCTRVEAISDIDIRNAHGFFRTMKFEQTSYRFVRAIQMDS